MMNTEQVSAVLQKCEVFRGLSDQELKSIAGLAKVEKFNAGDTIYPQGSIGTKLYVLSEGKVRLERRVDIGGNRKANVPVFVQRESPFRRLMGSWSELVGEQHTQMCTAKCYKPTTIISISSSDLALTLSVNPELRIKILEKLILLLRDRIASSYEAMETM
jgi:CRP-like cAMP-binding protein